MKELQIYANAGALARAAAEQFVALAAEAVAERGRFMTALAGGSTPRPAYELLATAALARQVDWTRTHVFWSDERAVPPDHADSNYRTAREALLERVPLPAGNVHRIQGELPPDEAAAVYERELETVLGAGGRFDLILLGMGSDGHTASLFPGTAALAERVRQVVAIYVEMLDAWRITLTLPAINAARQVTFLVSGAAKAEMLAWVRAGGSPTGRVLPAAQVAPVAGRLAWLVDTDAAGGDG